MNDKAESTDDFEFKEFIDQCVFHLAEAIENVRKISQRSFNSETKSLCESIEKSIRHPAERLAEYGIGAKSSLETIAPKSGQWWLSNFLTLNRNQPCCSCEK